MSSSHPEERRNVGILNRVSTNFFWTVLAIFVISFTVISFVKAPEQSDSSRAKSITQQLRCLECEGLSVNESETPTSKSILRDVERRVKDGQSNEEIFSYYESIYGEFIRLSPSTEKGNWLIYLFPIFGAIVLTAAIFISIKSSSKELKVGFWAATVLIAIIGVGIYISDVTRSDDPTVTAESEIATEVNSLEKLQEAVDLNPSNENLRNLAIVQFAQEKYVDALQNFDTAAQLDSADAISRGYASYIVMLSGEYDLALMRSQEAVQANGEEPTALFFRGLIYFSIPEDNPAYVSNARELANADFDKVLQLAPEGNFADQIRELRS